MRARADKRSSESLEVRDETAQVIAARVRGGGGWALGSASQGKVHQPGDRYLAHGSPRG